LILLCKKKLHKKSFSNFFQFTYDLEGVFNLKTLLIMQFTYDLEGGFNLKDFSNCRIRFYFMNSTIQKISWIKQFEL